MSDGALVSQYCWRVESVAKVAWDGTALEGGGGQVVADLGGNTTSAISGSVWSGRCGLVRQR